MRRDCQRQVNTCCEGSPCRWAIWSQRRTNCWNSSNERARLHHDKTGDLIVAKASGVGTLIIRIPPYFFAARDFKESNLEQHSSIAVSMARNFGSPISRCPW